MLVLISPSGSHLNKLLWSRAGAEKSTLIKNMAGKVLILIFLFWEASLLASATFMGRGNLWGRF